MSRRRSTSPSCIMLFRSNLQQGAGNVSVSTSVTRSRGIQRLAILARTLHCAHHALGGLDASPVATTASEN
jgi:hypothetical protein